MCFRPVLKAGQDLEDLSPMLDKGTGAVVVHHCSNPDPLAELSKFLIY